MKDKIKSLGEGVTRENVFIPIIIILVGFAAFGLGRLSADTSTRVPITIENVFPGESAVAGTNSSSLNEQTSGEVVSSINGTKYHYPWCSGAKNIKEENKIWFNTIEEARSSGYTAAKNCKGLK